MGLSRKEITSQGAPAKTQRSGFRGERKKEWSGRSPRRQAGTEQSGISSDESQEALKQHYPRKETAQDPQFFKRAYKDIRRFMEANGFDRRQYSVYVSQSELTTLDVAVLTQQMAEQLPWLRHCVREITATNIGARHSLLGLLCDPAPPAELLPPPVLREQQKKRKVPSDSGETCSCGYVSPLCNYLWRW